MCVMGFLDMSSAFLVPAQHSELHFSTAYTDRVEDLEMQYDEYQFIY